MRLFWLVVMVFVLAACGNSATAPTSTAVVDSGGYAGSWQLITLNGQPVTGNATLNLDAAGKANGKGGCNTFSSQITMMQNGLAFAPIVSTKMACVDQALNTLETQYLQTLQIARSMQADAIRLTFFDEQKQAILEFTRQ